MRQTATPILLCAVLGLAGCGSTDLARSFGFSRESPDEFLVTTQAPLSMPPGYMLTAPQPGVPRPQESTPRTSAEATLSPQASLAPAAGMSAGQQALVQAAGPPAPSDIRAQVNSQAVIDDPKDGFVEKLEFWLLPREPGVTVDAQAEADRLREAAALGQNTQDGTTRIIMPKRKTIFGF